MSNREHVRTVRVRAIDDTTPVLLGISRTMGGMRREISSLRMMLRLLAADELISAEAAETLGTALSFAIPVIGIAAGLISMLVGVTLTQRRSAIPIGQTLPGQYRTITAGGPVIAHKGEIIGRPMGGGVGGGGDFSIGNMTVNMKPDGESPEAIGRMFRTVRNSYSSDVPMT